MKNLTTLFLAIFVLVGCTLEREDYEKLPEEQFFKNEKDCQAAMANLYAPFSVGHGGQINGLNEYAAPMFSELATDIMYCYWGFDNIYNHVYDAFTGNMVDFFAFNRNLSICRGAILRIQNSKINDNLKAKYIAEAKTLHAYIALQIYKYIGPVPTLPDEDILNPSEVKYYEKPSDEEFVKMIADEVKESIDKLPNPGENDWGRMNKGVANMILLKLYMIERNWEEAKKYAQAIIDMNCYSLQDTYADVFAVANRRNSEIIHVNPRDVSTAELRFTWHALSLPNVYPSGTDQPKWGGYVVQWDFVNTFDKKDERLKGIVTEFVGTDGKLYNIDNRGSALRMGAVPLKYDIDPNFIGNGSNHDIIIYRYADVLLSMAEIINEMEGPTDEALSYFNQVRKRTGLGDLPKPSSKDEFRDIIFVERGHEFYCEGYRYEDMVRMGKYVDWMRKINPGADTRRIRFPIRNVYINEYKGKLKQNAGY